MENNEVLNALNLILSKLEDTTSCGTFSEDVRKARIILNNYVTQKLIEDKEKAENESTTNK